MSDESSSSNSSFYLITSTCFRSRISIFVFSAVSITYLLLIPLFILVLYMGYQQRRQQHSISTTAASHSNLFTYHAVAMQLNELLGLFLTFYGSYNNLLEMIVVGLGLLTVTSTGQVMFHILTSIEHYLAVVRPVTYLHLKQAGEVRIRNICAGCVWLLSFGWLAVNCVFSSALTFIFHLCIMAFNLFIISFCSISVLCVLKRPGPGQVGGNSKRVDQSKQKAFYTILAIMGVLLFRLVGNLIDSTVSVLTSVENICVLLMSTFWLDLPTNLVLPLLFLHRAGKLQCCKQNTQSG